MKKHKGLSLCERLLFILFNFILVVMKKDLKIKLNQLNKAELSEKEMNRLLGGDHCCTCGCQGISSSVDNNMANYADDLVSIGGSGVQHGEYN